jgi:hypothetical protein
MSLSGIKRETRYIVEDILRALKTTLVDFLIGSKCWNIAYFVEDPEMSLIYNSIGHRQVQCNLPSIARIAFPSKDGHEVRNAGIAELIRTVVSMKLPETNNHKHHIARSVPQYGHTPEQMIYVHTETPEAHPDVIVVLI